MTNKCFGAYIFALLFFLSTDANSSVITDAGKIRQIITYSTYGNGDVIIVLEQQSGVCDSGYWLRSSDPGFQNFLSFLLSAYHAQSEIVIAAHSTEIWPGSSTGKFCRLDWVRLGN